jgi:hypothetical protein
MAGQFPGGINGIIGHPVGSSIGNVHRVLLNFGLHFDEMIDPAGSARCGNDARHFPSQPATPVIPPQA